MRALALAVVQLDDDADPTAALATVPGATRYLVRPPEVAGTPPPGVHVLVADVACRGAAVDLVRAVAGAAVVAVLCAGEEASPELAAALVALPPGGATTFAVRRVHRFLGREIAGDPVVLAWRGVPDASTVAAALPGRLVTVEPDITTAIARLDRAATRAALTRAHVGAADFVIRPARGLLRRLWMRRRDGVPGALLAAIETYADIVVAAKVWEREERAARLHVQPSVRAVPPGFTAIDTRTGFVVVRDDLRDVLLRVLLDATPEIVEGEPLNSGGRGATWAITLAGGGRAVLRWYRRGGVVRHFIRDRYFGWRLRPLLELALTAEARRRGIAVPEVLGARVDHLRAGGYRGAIVTREIAGTETLGDAVRRGASGAERSTIVAAVARAVRTMHDRGLHHRDLNVGNILLRRAGEGVDVHLIDLDRARLRDRVARRSRRRALRRLARSVAKLEAPDDPRSAADRAAFHRAYREDA
jgi:tRNA A-37 threonylcarbamoyl transferase component Bud32